MVAKIVGLGDVISGISKKTARDYHGQSVHLVYSKPGVTGEAVMEQYLSFMELAQPPKLKVNDEIYLDFDSNGRLLSFEVVAPEK